MVRVMSADSYLLNRFTHFVDSKWKQEHLLPFLP